LNELEELAAIAVPSGPMLFSAIARVESSVALPLWGESRRIIPKDATAAANLKSVDARANGCSRSIIGND
jgi:hypothetical protein